MALVKLISENKLNESHFKEKRASEEVSDAYTVIMDSISQSIKVHHQSSYKLASNPQ